MTEPQYIKVSAGTALTWIGRSFGLYGKNPSIWIVMLLLFMAINFGLTMVPFLELLPTVLAPAFMVGFYLGCLQLQKGGALQIDHLFDGFKKQGRALIRLGLLYFACNIVIYFLTTLFLQSTISEEHMALIAQAQTQEQLAQLFGRNPELVSVVMNAVLIAVLLSIPLVMASWFSPALVAFQKVPPLKAMGLSIRACNGNILVFLVYGVVVLPMLVLAFIPLGLGLLIMLPVIIISQFVSYQTVFPNNDEMEDEQQGIITL
jgi:hypothetical protein